MAVRTAQAIWHGNLKDGNGVMKLDSIGCEGPYTYASRFEEGKGTNPEELIGAALASCYAMFLSSLLASNDHLPQRIEAETAVHLGRVDGAPAVTKIVLTCRGDVPGIHESAFLGFAKEAKEKCPISKALAVDIELEAALAA